jgi:predicted component of type VI protein secretion system
VLSADKGVSGKHCEIRQTNGQFEVVDTNSTNGTFVGDERVTAQVLKSGDTIRFGWMGPMVKVEFEEAVRAVHAGHPDDAQSTVMVSARRIQQAVGETPVPLAKEPAITMPPPSRAPAPPPAAAPPRPPAAPAAAPAPARAAPPPRPVATPAAGAWTAKRWALAIGLASALGALLAVAVWLVIR